MGDREHQPVTSVELTDEAIARIERDDDVINAICLPDFDRARAFR
jgi:amidase